MGRSSIVIVLLLFLVFSCSDSDDQSLGAYSDNSNAICKDSGLISAKSIIGENDWKPVGAGQYSLGDNEYAVAKLTIGGTNACTGFLINDNMIMTNNHCVSSTGRGVVAKFEGKTKDFSTDCSELILTNSLLDYSVLRCKQNFRGHIKPVTFGKNTKADGSNIYIVQQNCDYLDNPRCQVERLIAYGELYKHGRIIIDHTADTLAGSSGSPIFDEDTNLLVGLHNSGNIRNYDPNGLNHGISILKIMDSIASSGKSIALNYGQGDGGGSSISPLPVGGCQ